MPYKDKEKRLEYLKNWRKRNPNYMKDYKKTIEGKKICEKSTSKYKQTKKGIIVRKKSQKKWYKNNPKKVKANWKINDLRKYGNFTNDICGICSKEPTHFHHENYDLPYVGIFLCIQHHRDTHNGVI